MLKKICVVFAIIFCLSIYESHGLIFDSEVGTYVFYLESDSSNAVFLSVPASEASAKKKTLSCLRGEALTKISNTMVEYFLNFYGATLCFTEQAQNVSCNYYYSTKIPTYKLVNGQKINIQVAVSGELYTIGSPMIYGSF